jgi:hypothetical protein
MSFLFPPPPPPELPRFPWEKPSRKTAWVPPDPLPWWERRPFLATVVMAWLVLVMYFLIMVGVMVLE